MTYGEAKRQVLALLQEPKPDAALLERLPGYFDMAQREVASVCPLCRSRHYACGEETVLPADFLAVRRLWLLEGERRRAIGFSVTAQQLLPGESGELLLEYSASPRQIDRSTPDSTELELSAAAQDAMLFFVAAQCHSTEYDQRFFRSRYAQYQGRLENLAANEPPVATLTGGGRG